MDAMPKNDNHGEVCAQVTLTMADDGSQTLTVMGGEQRPAYWLSELFRVWSAVLLEEATRETLCHGGVLPHDAAAMSDHLRRAADAGRPSVISWMTYHFNDADEGGLRHEC